MNFKLSSNADSLIEALFMQISLLTTFKNYQQNIIKTTFEVLRGRFVLPSKGKNAYRVVVCIEAYIHTQTNQCQTKLLD